VGLVELFGLHQPAWMQWLMFSIVSVAGTLLLRRRLLERFRPPPDRDMDALAGNTAVALEVLAALGTGKVEMRGSTWTARNLDESPIAVGQPCRVERVEGLVLEVRSTARAASSTR
jgi:membrane protein implicated in regulation of membrane protease activity